MLGKPTRPSMDSAVRELVAHELGGEAIDKPWACDVMAANAEVIQAHVEAGRRNGEVPEAKFAAVTPKSAPLSDLLWRDFEHICRGAPWLAAEASRFVLTEVAGPHPDARVVHLRTSAGPLYVIGFRAALLHFLHSSFSKVFILSSYHRHADCLEEHDHILAGDAYSDTNLLAGLFNDIEILFDRRRLFVPVEPPHWANPLDYCERVEGARRFILAHEIAHTVWPDRQPGDVIGPIQDRFGLSEPQAAGWAEEIWCDAFALHALLALYGPGPLEGTALYEAESLVVGVLTYTTIMALVEGVLRETNTIDDKNGYPSFSLREVYIREVVRSHPLYSSSPQFQKSVTRVWRRLRSFAWFAGGANAPLSHGKQWSMIEFMEKLTPFGHEAYRAAFDEIVRDTAARRDEGESLSNILNAHF